MAIDGVSQLGKLLGDSINRQEQLAEVISPNEDRGVDIIVVSHNLKISGTVVGTAKYYAEDSFVLDHPVLCDLDSSVLELDGGYNEEETTIIFTKIL